MSCNIYPETVKSQQYYLSMRMQSALLGVLKTRGTKGIGLDPVFLSYEEHCNILLTLELVLQHLSTRCLMLVGVIQTLTSSDTRSRIFVRHEQ
jgi:hypothetical protein